MPLAPVGGVGQAEGSTQGRPHAVGPDRPAGVDPSDPVDLDVDPVGVLVGGAQGGALDDGGAGPARQLDESGVEVAAAGHGAVAPAVAGEREDDLASGGGAHDHVVDVDPGRHGRRIEAEGVELAQGGGGQPVAADLLPGEPGLVDDQGVDPGTRQGGGGGRARRPGPDHQDLSGAIGGGHGRAG